MRGRTFVKSAADTDRRHSIKMNHLRIIRIMLAADADANSCLLDCSWRRLQQRESDVYDDLLVDSSSSSFTWTMTHNWLDTWTERGPWSSDRYWKPPSHTCWFLSLHKWILTPVCMPARHVSVETSCLLDLLRQTQTLRHADNRIIQTVHLLCWRRIDNWLISHFNLDGVCYYVWYSLLEAGRRPSLDQLCQYESVLWQHQASAFTIRYVNKLLV